MSKLCDTTQLTHNLLTHTTCHHTTCSHTTWRHPPSLHMAGVALGHIHVRFTWQAWHLRHWAGSGGTPGSQLTPWTPRLFAWQAWHLVTSTFTLRGRRGTWSHPHSFHVAGVALTPPVITHTTCHHTTHTHSTHIQLNSQLCSHATQLTHNLLTYHTYNLSSYNLLTHNSTHTQLAHISHIQLVIIQLAHTQLGDIHLRFTWPAWHLVTSTFVSRGRRGTYGTGRALVAHRVLS